MANGNVRFYKLKVLPNFDESKKGIFVHVTETMYKIPWTPTNYGKEVNPESILMADRLTLLQWLTERQIESIESGLWFGGENGWELLSNETNSGAINDAIEAKIDTLVAGPYAQATITTDTPDEGEPNSSTLTIKGIKEADGIIGIPVDTENRDLNIKIDGVYNESTNKIATKSTVIKAIEALDVNTIQAVTFNTPVNGGNTTLTFKGIKEVDGKIAQGDEQTPGTFIVGDAKLKIQIGSAEATNVFSANAQVDSTIKLDGNVFKKNGDVFSIYTTEGVSSSNPLVTQQDIANLGGAMHYKGPLTGAQSGAGSWPSTVAAGDVYIVTTGFTHSGESNPFEVGDMIVFNSTSASDYKVVQSNITLGIGNGQIAANVGALTNGNLVVGVNDPESGKKGIKTVEFDVTNLTGTNGKNERNLTYDNGAADTADATLFHSATIKDTLKVIGKDFTETINISSTNRSIKIARNAGENDSTGVVVDLVWNTIIE